MGYVTTRPAASPHSNYYLLNAPLPSPPLLQRANSPRAILTSNKSRFLSNHRRTNISDSSRSRSSHEASLLLAVLVSCTSTPATALRLVTGYQKQRTDNTRQPHQYQGGDEGYDGEDDLSRNLRYSQAYEHHDCKSRYEYDPDHLAERPPQSLHSQDSSHQKRLPSLSDHQQYHEKHHVPIRTSFFAKSISRESIYTKTKHSYHVGHVGCPGTVFQGYHSQ